MVDVGCKPAGEAVVEDLAASEGDIALVFETPLQRRNVTQRGQLLIRGPELIAACVVAASPDITLTLEAEQTGTAQWALVKLTPRVARASMWGVMACGWPPRKPVQSLRSSMQIITTLGEPLGRSGLSAAEAGLAILQATLSTRPHRIRIAKIAPSMCTGLTLPVVFQKNGLLSQTC